MLSSPSTSAPPGPLLSLPPELLPHIASTLPYPDLLSLRLSHPHFYHSPLLRTNNARGIKLRVSWLCAVAPTSVANKSTHNHTRTLASLGITRLHIPGLLDWNVNGGGWSGFSISLRTDKEFLANRDVQRFLRRRWRHEECPPQGVQGGCAVVSGASCGGPKGRARGVGGKLKGWRYSFGGWEGMAVLLALAVWWVRAWVG
ncbi:hypothetical protein MMC10_003882 [Thelotrema lepadinum]|nr:hypothetical protein [Thelotrema lepadinum]